MAEIDDAVRQLMEKIERLRATNPAAAREVAQIIDDMVTFDLDFQAACLLRRPPTGTPS